MPAAHGYVIDVRRVDFRCGEHPMWVLKSPSAMAMAVSVALAKTVEEVPLEEASALASVAEVMDS